MNKEDTKWLTPTTFDGLLLTGDGYQQKNRMRGGCGLGGASDYELKR